MVRQVPPATRVEVDEYYMATFRLERVVNRSRPGLTDRKGSVELLSVTIRQGTLAGAVDKATRALELFVEPDVTIVARDATGDIPQAIRNGFTGKAARPEEEDEEDEDELEDEGP